MYQFCHVTTISAWLTIGAQISVFLSLCSSFSFMVRTLDNHFHNVLLWGTRRTLKETTETRRRTRAYIYYNPPGTEFSRRIERSDHFGFVGTLGMSPYGKCLSDCFFFLHTRNRKKIKTLKAPSRYWGWGFGFGLGAALIMSVEGLHKELIWAHLVPQVKEQNERWVIFPIRNPFICLSSTDCLQ